MLSPKILIVVYIIIGVNEFTCNQLSLVLQFVGICITLSELNIYI